MSFMLPQLKKPRNKIFVNLKGTTKMSPDIFIFRLKGWWGFGSLMSPGIFIFMLKGWWGFGGLVLEFSGLPKKFNDTI